MTAIPAATTTTGHLVPPSLLSSPEPRQTHMSIFRRQFLIRILSRPIQGILNDTMTLNSHLHIRVPILADGAITMASVPLQQSQKPLPKFETHRTVLVSLNEQLNTSANEPWSSPSAYSTHSLGTIREANDSGYISAEAERGFGKGTEKGVKEEVEVEEKSLVFAWDRFKDPGKKRGRAYRVDGEGDCFMSGV
jgi:hypothetical protein